MRGFTSALWPIRYKPLPDELLSCWLVRLAHGHGLKVQTFCNLIFGNQRQVWNRDIDRLAPTWLIDELVKRTGTSPEIAWGTTLRAYEGILYPKFRLAGALQWVLTLKMYHRTHQGFGLQFCPTCLAEDTAPYFRKRWRVALNTVCTRHGTMLLDRCSECGAGVAFHRLDIIRADAIDLKPLSYCHSCGFDLKNAVTKKPLVYDREASQFLHRFNCQFDQDLGLSSKWDVELPPVMHQLCRIMTARSKHVYLREFVIDQLGIQDIELTAGYVNFEMRPIQERHHLLQLATWLIVDFEFRLNSAWWSRSVRYNVLLKDFSNPPIWYQDVVSKLSNWRLRQF